MNKLENKKKIIILSIVITLVLAIAISFGYLGLFDINLNMQYLIPIQLIFL